MEIATCTGNDFSKKDFFLKRTIAPENCNSQELKRLELKKINKLTRDQFNAENPKLSKQTFDFYHVTITSGRRQM